MYLSQIEKKIMKNFDLNHEFIKAYYLLKNENLKYKLNKAEEDYIFKEINL